MGSGSCGVIFLWPAPILKAGMGDSAQATVASESTKIKSNRRRCGKIMTAYLCVAKGEPPRSFLTGHKLVARSGSYPNQIEETLDLGSGSAWWGEATDPCSVAVLVVRWVLCSSTAEGGRAGSRQ